MNRFCHKDGVSFSWQEPDEKATEQKQEKRLDCSLSPDCETVPTQTEELELVTVVDPVTLEV